MAPTRVIPPFDWPRDERKLRQLQRSIEMLTLDLVELEKKGGRDLLGRLALHMLEKSAQVVRDRIDEQKQPRANARW